jgi:hypothetical protein
MDSFLTGPPNLIFKLFTKGKAFTADKCMIIMPPPHFFFVVPFLALIHNFLFFRFARSYPHVWSNAFGAFIEGHVHQISARGVEVKQPGDDKGKYHASQKKVEKPMALPKPPGFGFWCLHNSCVVCFTPLVAELWIPQNNHIACSCATYFTDPKQRNTGKKYQFIHCQIVKTEKP